MRLPEIERGDGFANRLLISFISWFQECGYPMPPVLPFTTRSFLASRWVLGRRQRAKPVECRRA
jgi:hypothetical protein